VTHPHGDSTSPAEFNAEVVEAFRAQDGYVSGPLAGTPLMLVHHVGARSGIERIVPLAAASAEVVYEKPPRDLFQFKRESPQLSIPYRW
jgi:hypothetical protein